MNPTPETIKANEQIQHLITEPQLGFGVADKDHRFVGIIHGIRDGQYWFGLGRPMAWEEMKNKFILVPTLEWAMGKIRDIRPNFHVELASFADTHQKPNERWIATIRKDGIRYGYTASLSETSNLACIKLLIYLTEEKPCSTIATI